MRWTHFWIVFVNYYNGRDARVSRLVIRRLAYIILYPRFEGVDLGMSYVFRRAMWNLHRIVCNMVGRALSRIARLPRSPSQGWGICAWNVASRGSTQWKATSLETTDRFYDFPLWWLWYPLRQSGDRLRAWNPPSRAGRVCRTYSIIKKENRLNLQQSYPWCHLQLLHLWPEFCDLLKFILFDEVYKLDFFE